ncbi:MAG: ribonuclease P protein component [Betaproteobacteria bacterium HGW-Betaproteobacteria-13]|uniref:Ribonuclease P protein component n=1 Tax=Parazoarcus communis TaxID=41977 RepID=A0A2U8GRB4_9RHOO|nr:ribonuclease P protein component [Parazoarcus communis]PKO81367.1 MAG: ribonuclease P protein component [Betaproteobacteria bacterium HGW-Betaproteobacteria-13]PLX72590.1 MAG: ribonuclease P protein component [Azoarcus sp.]TVT54013.1 MAG: ribonuclease P protein component [Azoarcus sp. PHD]AWI76202.1 ribonuclease P protein component [Parazoarcus communis]AWI78851.1 ribonuclease P protein component [Parazoarcus communis]
MIDPSSADQGFRSAHRLHKTDEFSSVFAFRRALRGRFYMLHYRPNGLDTARLGVVVAKKLAKRANVRNLVKRIAREIFRRQRTDTPACDLIVRLHAPVATATRAELNQDLLQLLSRLPRL